MYLKLVKIIYLFLLYKCNAFPQNILNLSYENLNKNSNTIVPKLWLTISAQTRSVEIAWDDGRSNSNDFIVLTNQEPLEFIRVPVDTTLGTKLMKRSAQKSQSGYEQEEEASGNGSFDDDSYLVPVSVEKPYEEDPNFRNQWLCNNASIAIVTVIMPKDISGWITTTVPFDYDMLSRNVTVHTKCYGYWASYIDQSGRILSKNCIRAHPKWMNEMKSAIADYRVRDLFIPGTHDSGSYRVGFNPLKRDTLVTKYSLTQDDDVRGQLMHGIRYIDLRVGFYRTSNEKFFVNHGISRQKPLQDVLNQIIDFVMETNEIIIIDVQEFPVGFGKNLDVHRFLVHFLKSKLENILVDPSLGWQVTLREIWKRKQNVILSYDDMEVVFEFPTVLFNSVQQRWGDIRSSEKLEEFLKRMNERDTLRLSSRPVADMAELTPDTWGVITDRYGGLRKLADKVNHRISQLYMNDLGQSANIVAVDFYRGTTIIEAAIYWNSKKILA